MARKTDASYWNALFSAVGESSKLVKELVDANQLRTASCFLLVAFKLEGARVALTLAVELMQRALWEGIICFHLFGSLVLFVERCN